MSDYGYYSDGGYSDGGYSDGGYSDGGYSDGGYSDGGYSDGGYNDDGGDYDDYSDPGCSDGGYSDGGDYDEYSDPGCSDGGFDNDDNNNEDFNDDLGYSNESYNIQSNLDDIINSNNEQILDDMLDTNPKFDNLFDDNSKDENSNSSLDEIINSNSEKILNNDPTFGNNTIDENYNIHSNLDDIINSNNEKILDDMLDTNPKFDNLFDDNSKDENSNSSLNEIINSKSEGPDKFNIVIPISPQTALFHSNGTKTESNHHNQGTNPHIQGLENLLFTNEGIAIASEVAGHTHDKFGYISHGLMSDYAYNVGRTLRDDPEALLSLNGNIEIVSETLSSTPYHVVNHYVDQAIIGGGSAVLAVVTLPETATAGAIAGAGTAIHAGLNYASCMNQYDDLLYTDDGEYDYRNASSPSGYCRNDALLATIGSKNFTADIATSAARGTYDEPEAPVDREPLSFAGKVWNNIHYTGHQFVSGVGWVVNAPSRAVSSGINYVIENLKENPITLEDDEIDKKDKDEEDKDDENKPIFLISNKKDGLQSDQSSLGSGNILETKSKTGDIKLDLTSENKKMYSSGNDANYSEKYDPSYTLESNENLGNNLGNKNNNSFRPNNSNLKDNSNINFSGNNNGGQAYNRGPTYVVNLPISNDEVNFRILTLGFLEYIGINPNLLMSEKSIKELRLELINKGPLSRENKIFWLNKENIKIHFSKGFLAKSARSAGFGITCSTIAYIDLELPKICKSPGKYLVSKVSKLKNSTIQIISSSAISSAILFTFKMTKYAEGMTLDLINLIQRNVYGGVSFSISTIGSILNGSYKRQSILENLYDVTETVIRNNLKIISRSCNFIELPLQFIKSQISKTYMYTLIAPFMAIEINSLLTGVSVCLGFRFAKASVNKVVNCLNLNGKNKEIKDTKKTNLLLNLLKSLNEKDEIKNSDKLKILLIRRELADNGLITPSVKVIDYNPFAMKLKEKSKNYEKIFDGSNINKKPLESYPYKDNKISNPFENNKIHNPFEGNKINNTFENNKINNPFENSKIHNPFEVNQKIKNIEQKNSFVSKNIKPNEFNKKKNTKFNSYTKDSNFQTIQNLTNFNENLRIPVCVC